MTLRQREPREKNERYLAHVRAMPCLICAGKAEPAHIRTGNIAAGHRGAGGGEKSSDKWALPLCRMHHEEQHMAGGEIIFWNYYGLDPFATAARLWNAWRKINGSESTEGKSCGKRRRSPATGLMRTAPKKPSAALPNRKSPWPKRHGTMKSRNSFGRQERRT